MICLKDTQSTHRSKCFWGLSQTRLFGTHTPPSRTDHWRATVRTNEWVCYSCIKHIPLYLLQGDIALKTVFYYTIFLLYVLLGRNAFLKNHLSQTPCFPWEIVFFFFFPYGHCSSCNWLDSPFFIASWKEWYKFVTLLLLIMWTLTLCLGTSSIPCSFIFPYCWSFFFLTFKWPYLPHLHQIYIFL